MGVTGLGLFDDRPVSYLGTVEPTAVLFRTGLLAAAALFAAFSLFARDTFSAPLDFLVVSWIGMVGQAIVAVVPLSGAGAAHAVHTTAGLVLGISLPILMWRFASGQPPGPWRVATYRLFWLESTACVVGVVLSWSGRAALAEILPAGAYHLWVGVLTSRASRRGRTAGAGG